MGTPGFFGGPLDGEVVATAMPYRLYIIADAPDKGLRFLYQWCPYHRRWEYQDAAPATETREAAQ